MLIGLTGPSGSGKSSIARILSEMDQNVVHLDIDKVNHLIIEMDTVKGKLVDHFGTRILVDGKIDRKVLGRIVFNNQSEMRTLMAITERETANYINNFILVNKDKIAILDHAVLPKTPYWMRCDLRILVDAPFDIRLERATARDTITEEKFREREKARLDYSGYQLDYTINNIGLEETRKEVRRIYEKSIIRR